MKKRFIESPHNMTFLNGWIGERLAEEWLKMKGYDVESKTLEPRGTDKATSSGDIDLIAKKGSEEVIYVEVKSWGKNPLNPSWLVEFMLERKKLNTLFIRRSDATQHILIYRFPPTGSFIYKGNLKYIKKLISGYNVPNDLIRNLSGEPSRKFVEVILEYLVHRKAGEHIKFNIIYFEQFLEELSKHDKLDNYYHMLKEELFRYFDKSFRQITSSSLGSDSSTQRCRNIAPSTNN